MLAVLMSLVLITLSAALSFAGVRYVNGTLRSLVFCAALICASLSFYWGDALGGFWAGFYTLISTYTFICVALPWLEFLLKPLKKQHNVS